MQGGDKKKTRGYVYRGAPPRSETASPGNRLGGEREAIIGQDVAEITSRASEGQPEGPKAVSRLRRKNQRERSAQRREG